VNCISPPRQQGHPLLARSTRKEKEEGTMTIGCDKPQYVLPLDHRATFSKNLFGWQGSLSPEQTAR
jgi:hypothetical protein